MAKAVAEVEAEDVRAFASALAEADPLGDHYWLEHEGLGPCYPDDCCYRYCPHDPLREARREINEYLNRGGSHE